MSEKAILNVDAVMVDRDEDRSRALHGSHTMKRFVDFREYPRKALRTVSTHEDHNPPTATTGATTAAVATEAAISATCAAVATAIDGASSSLLTCSASQVKINCRVNSP